MKRVTAIKWGTEEMGSPRLAAMGKIKIGGKGEERTSKSGGKYRLPVKYSHFVITSKERGADGNFRPDADLMRGIDPSGKPTEIAIILMYDNIDKNFPHRLACFDGQQLWCQGDGIDAYRRNNGGWAARKCPCELLKTADGNKKCKPNGNLAVVIKDAPQVGAIYEYTTTSWETVRNIVSSLMHIQTITGGILAGIPLALVMYPSTDRVETAKGTTSNLNYKVAVTFKGGYRALAECAQEAAKNRLAARVDMKELESGRAQALAEDLSTEEQADIVQEFYPETIAGETVSGEVVDVDLDNEPDSTPGPETTAKDDPGPDTKPDAPDPWDVASIHVRELGEALGKTPKVITASIKSIKTVAGLEKLAASWEELIRANGGEDKGGQDMPATNLPSEQGAADEEPYLGF